MSDLSADFRVVRILDEFSVVIDGGYNQEIKRGDIFQIFVPGEEIHDPENPNIVIGTLDTVKATIIATQISPSVTICKNAEQKSGLTLKISPEWQNILSALSATTRPMHVDPTQIQSASFSTEPIKIGDKVRKLPKKSLDT